MLASQPRSFLLLVALLGLSGDARCGSQPRNNEIPLTGTFSSLEYHTQSGDLLGEEIRVVLGRDGYQAAIQFGEGEPSNLIVVDVDIENTGRIRFSIGRPDAHAGQFDGHISPHDLTGVLRFENGAKKLLKLKRGPSYWD